MLAKAKNRGGKNTYGERKSKGRESFLLITKENFE
jgi:hypothetical protein